jgi:hypothetical protein
VLRNCLICNQLFKINYRQCTHFLLQWLYFSSASILDFQSFSQMQPIILTDASGLIVAIMTP